MFNQYLVLITLVGLQFVLAEKEKSYHATNFLPNRIGIIELFQWPYNSIAKECEEFLGPKGIAAVEVSPVHENHIISNRPWYEIYQPISYKIKNRLGDESQFSNMVKRCNDNGVRVIVDLVLNHMSGLGETSTIKGVAGSLAIPKLKLYAAVPYTILDFHKDCSINDWNNKTQMEICQLSELPDLDQSKLNVRLQLVKMMNKLIKLGVAGFRISNADLMNPDQLKVIYDKVKDLNTDFNFSPNSRPLIYHITNNKWKNDYINIGKIVEPDYSSFLTKIMRNKIPLQESIDIGDETLGFLKNSDAIVDVDNHDIQRTANQLTYREPIEFRMATAFMLAFPYGIPKIMSSFAFKKNEDGPPADANGNILDPTPNEYGKCSANWNCEHHYEGIPEMIEFAKITQDEKLQSFWSNDDGQASFCRGHKGFIAFNAGKTNMDIELDTCLEAGTYCDIATGKSDNDSCSWKKTCTGREIIVNNNGKARIVINSDDGQKFIAIHIKSLLK